MSKIFGIGFHKTGTTSLARALRLLGYRVAGPNGVMNPNIARDAHRIVDRLVPQFDAFQDNPWPVLYQYLDRRYPGSRFILTVRDPQAWIASQLRYFGTGSTPMREWIYGAGSPIGNEEIYLRRYEQHNREVLAWFAGRSDLLVMDIARGDGWPALCAFLHHEVPAVPFPHENRSEAD